MKISFNFDIFIKY